MGYKPQMIDENKQAVLLLSTYFSSPKKGDPTPLTLIEYGRFARWLHENSFQPKDLFNQFDGLMRAWLDPKGKITTDRLRFLLGRGMAMGLALEKWQSAGIWIISRSDQIYPRRLKKHLGESAPALLFGLGNQQLLNAGGLSIVGSRNIDEEDQQYTKKIAQQAAMEGMNVISGGARGVDETAMLAALQVEGTALGILSNDLFKAALAGKWRQYLKNNQLALISPFYPEASFQVGNAMGRNKYIYCLSDYALVIRSEEGTGGTWAGAKENCKKKWVPLFVKAQSDATGNLALVDMGASTLNSPEKEADGQTEWLIPQLKGGAEAEKIPVSNQGSDSVSKEQSDVEEFPPVSDSYLVFVELLEKLLKQDGQITLAQLKEARTDLSQREITDWLDRASEESLIERKGKSRTYIRKSAHIQQPDFFA